MRRLVISLAAVAAVLLGTTTVSAAAPSSPEVIVLEDYFEIYPAPNLNLSVFINITARAYCEWDADVIEFFHWLEAEELWQEYLAFEGTDEEWEDERGEPPPTDPGEPPPDPGPPPAMDPVETTVKTTGKGAVVGRIDEPALHIELWQLDEDPSPLRGPCEDIAEQLADPGAGPWATGKTAFRATSNDVFQSGTRASSGGEYTWAQVTDGQGNEYRFTNVFHVNDRCRLGDYGPPACLIDRSKLQPVS